MGCCLWLMKSVLWLIKMHLQVGAHGSETFVQARIRTAKGLFMIAKPARDHKANEKTAKLEKAEWFYSARITRYLSRRAPQSSHYHEGEIQTKIGNNSSDMEWHFSAQTLITISDSCEIPCIDCLILDNLESSRLSINRSNSDPRALGENA